MKLSEGQVRVTVIVELVDPDDGAVFAKVESTQKRRIGNPAMGAPLIPWQIGVEADHVVSGGSIGQFVESNAERLFGGKP